MNKWDYLDFIIQLLLWTCIVSTPLHEYGHLLAVRVAGGEGAVYSYDLDAMRWETMPNTKHLWFVYLGGGLFAGLVFLFAYLRCCDWELRFCFMFNAGVQFGYGVFESLFHSTEPVFSILIGLVVGVFMVYLYVLRRT